MSVSEDSFNAPNTLLVQDVQLETFEVGSQSVEAVSLILKEPKELETYRSKVSLELFRSVDSEVSSLSQDKGEEIKCN